MEIILNGKKYPLENPQDVTALLQSIDVPLEMTAVEINGVLLTSEQFGTQLGDGDRVEVVRFVGGG